MWPINGLEAIQSEIKKMTKIKNKTTLPPPFFDVSGRETNFVFYLALEEERVFCVVIMNFLGRSKEVGNVRWYPVAPKELQ